MWPHVYDGGGQNPAPSRKASAVPRPPHPQRRPAHRLQKLRGCPAPRGYRPISTPLGCGPSRKPARSPGYYPGGLRRWLHVLFPGGGDRCPLLPGHPCGGGCSRDDPIASPHGQPGGRPPIAHGDPQGSLAWPDPVYGVYPQPGKQTKKWPPATFLFALSQGKQKQMHQKHCRKGNNGNHPCPGKASGNIPLQDIGDQQQDHHRQHQPHGAKGFRTA